MKNGLKENFRKGKLLGLYLDNLPRKVEVLNLQAIHLDQVQNLLARPKHYDLHNRLDLVRHHLVLLPEVILHQKDALVVINFTLDLTVLLKCVISEDRQTMLGSFVQCLILLHQWSKL